MFLVVVLGLVVMSSASCVTNSTCPANWDCRNASLTAGVSISACVPTCSAVNCTINTASTVCTSLNEGIECQFINGTTSSSPCGNCSINTDCMLSSSFGYVCMDSCQTLNCLSGTICEQNTTTLTTSCVTDPGSTTNATSPAKCNSTNPCSCNCSNGQVCACTAGACGCTTPANVSSCQQLGCPDICEYNVSTASYTCTRFAQSLCPGCQPPNVCDYNQTNTTHYCTLPWYETTVSPANECNGSCPLTGDVCIQDTCVPWNTSGNVDACTGLCGPDDCKYSNFAYSCVAGTTCSQPCNSTEMCEFTVSVGWGCVSQCGACPIGEICDLVQNQAVCTPILPPGDLCNNTCIDPTTYCGILPNGSYSCISNVSDPCASCASTEGCFRRKSNTSALFCASTCDDVACSPDQVCKSELPPTCSRNCSLTTCGPKERCAIINSTEVCEPLPVADPCGNCTSSQQCKQDGNSTRCEDIDICNLDRRKAGLVDCLFPEKCEVRPGDGPVCIPPKPTACVESDCKADGKVCGPNGDCIIDKCDTFSWPPIGTEYCTIDGTCPPGSMCTGCTASATCDSSTGNAVFGNDCRPTCESFNLTCDVAMKATWTLLEVKSCCLVAGIGCDSYDCIDGRSVEEWTADQKTYCCNSTGKGCPLKPGEYECLDGSDEGSWEFAKRKWCCDNRQVGCPVGYDCSSDSSTWPPLHVEYCCKIKGKGCTPATSYDCTWNNQTTSAWDSNQRDWCCATKGIRCPPQDRFTCPEDTSQYTAEQQKWCCANKKRGCPYDCVVKSTSREAWSEDQRTYCCLYDGIGCKANTGNFDCFDTSSSWSSEQKEYCCDEEDIGCPLSCNSVILSGNDKKSCCESKGLFCDNEINYPAIQPNVVRKRFRLSFRADWGSVLRNPKRMIRRFKNTLFHASQTAIAEGTQITIEFIGSKTPGEGFPPDDSLHKWGVIAAANWSSGALPEEVARPTKGSPSRNYKTLSETMNEATTAADSVFVYYSLQSEDESSMNTVSHEIDLATIYASKTTPSGAMHDNAEGYSLILRQPKNELFERDAGATEPPMSSPSSDRILYIIGLVLGLVVLGGFVGFYINRQKRPSALTEYSGQLEEVREMTPAERKIFETPETVETGTI